MCQKPCPECPYKKDSASGYFGGNDPDVYRQAITGEAVVPCHTRSKHAPDGSVDQNGVVPCTGHIAAQIVSCKIPRNSELRHLHDSLKQRSDYREIEDNALSVFDFSDHHGIG